MSEKSPAYLWYPKDALSSGRIAELSAEEECWYRRALDHSWLDEGLPADVEKCARRIGKGCTIEAAQMILETFFRLDGSRNRYVNSRLEKERSTLRQNSKKKSAAGKAGAAKRWHNKTSDDSRRIADASQTHSIPIAIASINNTHINAHEAREFDYPIGDLFQAFPDVILTPAHLGQIASTVKDTPEDRTAWASTIALYQGNRDPITNSYNPAKIGTVLNIFKKERDKLSKAKQGNGNGKPKRSNTDAINEWRAFASTAVSDRIPDQSKQIGAGLDDPWAN